MLSHPPHLIVVGGYPGSGKTSIARRLATELHTPWLSSDMIGQTITASSGRLSHPINATWMSYDIVFDLCEEFLHAGVSTMLDLNMGWSFQWQRLDELRMHIPHLSYTILLLRCPRTLCHARLVQRNTQVSQAEVIDLARLEPRFLEMWQFLEQLNRPDIHSIDAARPLDQVYADVWRYLMQSAS
jgi:predicted kinase